MARCNVCFRNCEIKEGGKGVCGARSTVEGKVVPINYGKLTSIALDPIEKKPLNRFYPGSKIVSVGSFGCNLRCPFCQNCEISWSEHALALAEDSEGFETRMTSPEELADIAEYQKRFGNIGVAFTYNEPLIGYEYVRDTAKLVHERGMKNVLVSNGTASLEILEEIAPYIDAMNIDLKGFKQEYYRDFLGGNLDMTLEFIKKAVTFCHVELTTLVVPGKNDSEEEMNEIADWISQLKDKGGDVIGDRIPLHILRFFPRFKMGDREPTDVTLVHRLAQVAEKKLKYVYAAY